MHIELRLTTSEHGARCRVEHPIVRGKGRHNIGESEWLVFAMSANVGFSRTLPAAQGRTTSFAEVAVSQVRTLAVHAELALEQSLERRIG